MMNENNDSVTIPVSHKPNIASLAKTKKIPKLKIPDHIAKVIAG